MDILSQQRHTAKKDHMCDYCMEVIQKGKPYNRAFLVESGDSWEWKSHVSCDALVEVLEMYDGNPGEGITTSIFMEYVNEAYNELYSEIKNPAYKPTFIEKLIDVKLAVLDGENI